LYQSKAPEGASQNQIALKEHNLNNTGRLVLFDPEAVQSVCAGSDSASAGYAGRILTRGLAADIFLCAVCSSTFDAAWKLAGRDLLPEWSSVLALRQTSGRGQLRRGWYSPPGNHYASIRLPELFLRESSAPVLTALLFVEAFAGLGLRLRFKWPNDLTLCGGEDNTPGKVGGLLLEDRAEVLLAGVGINCAKQPGAGMLRENAALPARVLPQDFSWRSPVRLWIELVQQLIFTYNTAFTNTSTRRLLLRAEEYLLWKGSNVQVLGAFTSDSVTAGILCGLTEQGGLRLLVPCAEDFFPAGPRKFEEVAVYAGSVRGVAQPDGVAE
jgi:BirA family biotin operon repressor/biotin-[acetyl-CoA-carboxylase] ligase